MVRGTPAASGPVDVYATVARLARAAAAAGTFGVGGVLAGDTGAVVAEATNGVVVDGRVADPTAHVERQLVDWYFAAGPRDVRPDALTIVTSLEPCMMCAGSILRAGFRCVALTDDEAAGVGIRRDFPTLSAVLRARARARFGSAGVRGRRAFAGAQAAGVAEEAHVRAFEDAGAAFDATWAEVRALSAGTRDAVAAPAPAAREEIAWITGATAHDVHELPSIAAAVRRDGAVAALADGDGRLLYVAAGRTDRSPIRTPVMECLRGFARVRPHVERTLSRRLPPGQLTLIVSAAFDCEEDGIMALGAAGSFVEAALPSGRPPFVQLAGAAATQVEWLQSLLDRFPPFYRDFVGLRVGLLVATR